MAKKRTKRDRRPSRRAKRILDRARLEARVIVAEARAQTTDARLSTLAEAHLEAGRIRAEAEREALRAVEQAHTDAGWILTQARQFAQSEARALTAEAELGAERLQASAVVAAEQLRREALAEREQALRDLAAERTQMRNDALLEAAHVRDEARTETTTFLARLDAEREAILAAARVDAKTMSDRAEADRTDEHIVAFLDGEAEREMAAESTVPVTPVSAIESVAAFETVILFDEGLPPAEDAPGEFVWNTESAAPSVSARTWPQPSTDDDTGFWALSEPEPTRRRRRWRRSGAGRS